MKIKEILKVLREYSPSLFRGSQDAEVKVVVEDYQSRFEPEGIFVLDGLGTKGSKCAPTVVTCNTFLGLLPPNVENVIVVDIDYLDGVYYKLNRIL